MDRGYRDRGVKQPCALEFADKSNLGLETHSELLLDCVLRDDNQLANIASGRLAEVDHDVGVNVRDLGIAMAESLEPALVDETASSHSLDFFEDRAGAWMELKPGMTCTPPAQILLHDAMHDGGIAAFELKGHRESDILPMVKDAGIVAKLHELLVDSLSLSLFRQELARMKDVGDEHRSLSLGLGFEEMKILPDSAADRAGNADVVFETRPSALDSFRYEVCNYSTALDPQPAIVGEREVARVIADH